MLPDERTRELVRQREKARLDWNSDMYNAEMRGKSKKEAESIQKMRTKGMTDEEINSILFS